MMAKAIPDPEPVGDVAARIAQRAMAKRGATYANEVRRLLDAEAAGIEVRADAEAAYTAWVHREMEKTVWHDGGCTSWYRSRSGRVIAMFPGFSFSFRRLARRFRPDHHVLIATPADIHRSTT